MKFGIVMVSLISLSESSLTNTPLATLGAAFHGEDGEMTGEQHGPSSPPGPVPSSKPIYSWNWWHAFLVAIARW